MNIWILLGLFFVTCSPASSTAQNVTIDDSDGDLMTGARPEYGPNTTVWHMAGLCPGCAVQPSESLAFRGTWHDSTFMPRDIKPNTVTLRFNGSAIYAYCIMAPTSGAGLTLPKGVTTTTNLSFVLDEEAVGTFYREAEGNDYQYNVNIYANESLEHAEHALEIASFGADPGSLFLFDYAIYTWDPDAEADGNNTKTSRSSHIGAIVGGVLGSLLALALIALAAVLLTRRRRRQTRSSLPPPSRPANPVLVEHPRYEVLAPQQRPFHPYPISTLPVSGKNQQQTDSAASSSGQRQIEHPRYEVLEPQQRSFYPHAISTPPVSGKHQRQIDTTASSSSQRQSDWGCFSHERSLYTLPSSHYDQPPPDYDWDPRGAWKT